MIEDQPVKSTGPEVEVTAGQDPIRQAQGGLNRLAEIAHIRLQLSQEDQGLEKESRHLCEELGKLLTGSDVGRAFGFVLAPLLKEL